MLSRPRIILGSGLVMAVFLTGCGLKLYSFPQEIEVHTPFAEKATCVLTDSGGRTWELAKTPGKVMVQKGGAPLAIICRKAGFKTGTDLVKSLDFATKDHEQGFHADPWWTYYQDQEKPYYPPVVVVWLEPQSFVNKEAREAWFNARRDLKIIELERMTIPAKWEANRMIGVAVGRTPGSHLSSDEAASRLEKSRIREP